jgi:2-dehydropantoate 2-reductase
MAPRVLIFGTGSIGACYAFIISRAVPASNIVTVCRSNYAAVSKNGFTINSTKWGLNQNFHPTVVRSVTEAMALNPDTPFDFVVVCSKAIPSVPSTAELISPAVSPNTTIVLIQNGIATEEPFSQLFPKNSLLSTVVYLPATQTSPGVVYHKETELLHIGSYPASSNTDSATIFSDLIKAGGGSTAVHKDVQFERWSKLLVNAWNPICALSRSQDAYFLRSNPDAVNLIRELMLEFAAVANACGYPAIDAALVNSQLKRATVREPPGVEPSMMADALAGRNMEVEAIVGNVFRLSQEKGVNTPLLRSIYILVGALNDSFTRSMQRRY